MVKSKNIIIYILISVFCFAINSCNIDFAGFFVSTELDERLKDKDHFVYLDNSSPERSRAGLSFGTSYKFIVLSDTHLEEGETFDLEKLHTIIENDVKFIVICGDITQHGTEQDINSFLNIADDIAGNYSIPVYPVIGNHDIYFGNWKNWRRLIGSSSYRVDADTTTLFFLDTANSYFGKEQMDWLERELASVKDNVFIFTHSPLFITGPVSLQQITDTGERARIVNMLRDKCDIMFMGHLHKQLYNKIGNVRYVGVESFYEDKTYVLVTVGGSNITYKIEKL